MPLFDTIYHTYKHRWNDISLASWRKYPCPDRPDVLSVDMLTKDLDPVTGVLKCTRLMICKGSMPSWLVPILGSNECFFYEEAIVDPKTQTMVLKSKNLSFSNILGLEEVCTYTPDPNNNEWTHFKQEATVTASIFGVAKKVESFCLDKFKANAQKGRNVMEQAILKVKREAEELEQTIDKAITTVVHEAEEGLQSIDKIITHAKLEAEEGLQTIDKMITTVKNEAEGSLAQLEAKLDKSLLLTKQPSSIEDRIFDFDKTLLNFRRENLGLGFHSKGRVSLFSANLK
ncbi:hypothetical protein SAMD00019534_000300, partial [Acytostelium subglobosum LB1]|uniref:hypothetical protein n=1 Tax=Acytostelium subglobosum LB1 TaxID=1410327 RepID=UPI000644E968